MYKRVKTKKLGRTVSHRNALVQNMVRSMVVSGSVKTTTPKAKVLKGEMESILTKIENTKDGDLSLRRDLQVMLGNSDLVKKLLGIKGAKVVIKKVGF
jgi:large subunit ribosomal protein L17